MTTTAMTLSEIRLTLHRALRALSGVCDGAHSRDTTGFNGGDSPFGKSLAASDPNRWSAKQTYCAAKMLRKYAKQLQGHGIDISEIPPLNSPEDVATLMAPAMQWDTSKDAREAAASRVYRNSQPQPVRHIEVPAQLAINPRKIVPMPDGYWRVFFPYDANLVAGIKSLPYQMRQWDNASKTWLVKIESKNAEQELRAAEAFGKFVLEGGFEDKDGALLASLSKIILQAGKKVAAMRENESASFAQDADLQIDGLGGELRAFQKAGVAFAVKNERCIIGDEMGLGKSCQSLATLQAKDAFPALIVCRSTLKPNWLREAAKWLPSRSLSGNVFDKADVRIVTHHELTKHADWICQQKWEGLVADESQDFKGSKAQRTKALRLIADETKPRIRLLLSGTPILNRPAELITQLQIIDRLKDMGGWKHFTNHFCAAFQGPFGMEISGASNLPEMNGRLRSSGSYVRRLKRDVLRELPDKTEDVIPVELDNRKAYETAEAEIAQRLAALMQDAGAETARVCEEIQFLDLEELIEFALEAWPKITKAQQLQWKQDANADSVRSFIIGQMKRKEAGTASAGAIMLLGKLAERAAEGKVAAVAEWAKEATEGGRKLILFAHHRSVQEKLFRAIPGAIWTRDETRFKNSQAAVDVFQNDPSIPVIVCSLKGDNAGLTITAADMVGFIQRDWTPATMEQAAGRAHRIGQKNAVNVYIFDAVNTIDSTLAKVLADKAEIVDAASNGSLPVERAKKDVADSLVSVLISGRKRK